MKNFEIDDWSDEFFGVTVQVGSVRFLFEQGRVGTEINTDSNHVGLYQIYNSDDVLVYESSEPIDDFEIDEDGAEATLEDRGNLGVTAEEYRKARDMAQDLLDAWLTNRE